LRVIPAKQRIDWIHLFQDLNMAPVVNFVLDMNQVLRRFEARMEQLEADAALALSAILRYPDAESLVPIPTVIEHTGDAEKWISTTKSRDSAAAWITGTGLRDATDLLVQLCEDVWRLLVLLRHCGQGLVEKPAGVRWQAGDEVSLADSLFPGECKKIDRGGLFDKLQLLENEFGVTTTLKPELETIAKARNCLTHRAGIVSLRDATPSAALQVKYRYHTLAVKEPDGTIVRLTERSTFQHGGELHLQIRVPGAREFAVGARIMFTPQEYMHVLTTFRDSAAEIVQSSKGAGGQLSPVNTMRERAAELNPPSA
jgi:hypothetical protein